MVCWGSPVEVYSETSRLHRDKEITDLDEQGAAARLRLLNRGWREILPDDHVRELATRSPDNYPLWARDDLQLAASLDLVRTAPDKEPLRPILSSYVDDDTCE